MEQAAIAVAVVGSDGTVDLKPPAERPLARGECVLAITRETLRTRRHPTARSPDGLSIAAHLWDAFRHGQV